MFPAWYDNEYIITVGASDRNTRYSYVVSQTFSDTPDIVLGNEHYEIYKNIRTPFQANAGDDSTINLGDSITLSAATINEDASYKWYDQNNNLIDSGMQITVSPNTSKTYKLEVIADSDGFKDYDEVSITVRKYFLNSVTPNPSSSQVTIGYQCLTALTASLSFCLPNGTVYATCAINPQNNSANIDISQFPSGIYTLSLICDGQLTDSKLLQKN